MVVANHAPDGVRLHVIDLDREVETLRSEPLAFSMGGDVTPALVPLERGLIVAMANYGDFDPTGGLIEVVAVGSDGRPGPTFSVSTRRSGRLDQGGISAASDGEVIVVHWAAMLDEGLDDLPVPVTQAMTFRCE